MSSIFEGRRPAIIIAATLLVGLALQLVLWSRQWMYGDQYALLTPALSFLESGELAPFSKGMSGGGRIPGSLLQLLVALPLAAWADFRAPALLMGLTHVAAIFILLRVVARTSGIGVAAAFVAVYWLSPWRLYHAGALWEPGFLFLPAALHLWSCWVLRPEAESSVAAREPLEADAATAEATATTHPASGRTARRMLASLTLAAMLVAAVQIHASFVVLLVATVLLAYRRLIRVDLLGAGAGLVVGGLTLLPTLAAIGSGGLLDTAPAVDRRVSLPLLVASNAGKSFLYWLRLGSADVGRRLRQTAWLSEPPAGTEPAFDLPAALVGGLSVLAAASVLIAVVASWKYLRAAPSERRDPWLRDYTATMLSAVVLAAATSPVPIQGWHMVIALHAACLPVAFLLAEAFGAGGWKRSVAVGFIFLLVSVSVCVAAGHPAYMWPDKEHALEQNIPDYLRPLIPERR